jgi:Mg-chelatase subunit ChlD
MSRRRLATLFCLLPAAVCLVALAGRPMPSHAQTPTEAYARIATWQSVAAPKVSGLFKGPWGVAVGADDRIYVADSALGAVHVLAGDGKPLAIWDGGATGLGAPRDVAVGEGVVYVSDPDAGLIHLLEPDGRVRTSWTVSGNPGGLAYSVARHELFVTTLGSREVLVLGTDGVVKRRWDGSTSNMQEPWGVAVGPDERVYVSDIGADARTVWAFDAQGTLLNGYQVTADGITQSPLDVAVDEDNDLYVVTELQLARFHDGVLVGQPLRTPGGRGVATGPGSGLVTTVQDYRVGFTGVRYYRDRRAVALSATSWGGPFAPLGAIEGPRRLSANRDARVFVLDTWPRVQAWNTDGTPRAQFGVGGIHDIAAGRRGSAYAIDGRRLALWPEDGVGGSLWSWEPPGVDPNMGNPYAWLTLVDAFEIPVFGNAALIHDIGDQRFYAIDTSGNPVAEWAIAPPDGFESVADAALAADKVVLINRTQGRIELRKLADGAVERSWTTPGAPIRLDIGFDNHVYVLNRAGWVWKYALDGTLVAVWPVIDPNLPQAPGQVPVTDIAAGENGLVYVALGEAGEVAVFAPDAGGKPLNPPAVVDRCALVHDKTARPGQIVLGQSVEVQLTVEGECPLADGRSDILLLVDTSGSMSGAKMSAARSAALEFVGQLDYSLNQIGLISFSTDVALVQPLTNNPRALIRAIPGLGDDSGTNLLGAIQLAQTELASPRARPAARKALILLTDGRPNSGVETIESLADEFRNSNVDVYAIGLGLDVDRDFLGGIATSPNYYFEAPTEFDLIQIYNTIARRVVASALLEQVTVTDVLPADMRFVTNSASPPATYDATSRTLSWTQTNVSPGGLRLRYRVEPQAPGRHPTNVRAEADYVDGVGKPGQILFPVPEVMVTKPVVWRAYLPILYRQKCAEVRADVVVAIDTSNSMREGTGVGNQTKLEAAIAAARVFIGQLHLPQDRVALVAFNGTAQTVQPLTGDWLTLLRALDRLPSGSGTRIDLGLDAGVEALAKHAPPNVSVIVLLTDGNQSGGTPADVDRAVARATGAGVHLFTIGLGSDVNRELLIQVAGDEKRAYFAPTAAELAGIYRTIAEAIPCVGEG